MKRILSIFVIAMLLLAIGGTATASAQTSPMMVGSGTVTGLGGESVQFWTALSCETQSPRTLVVHWDNNWFILQGNVSAACYTSLGLNIEGVSAGLLITPTGIETVGVDFRFVDAGELPSDDCARIRIPEEGTTLEVSTCLSSGNLRAIGAWPSD